MDDSEGETASSYYIQIVSTKVEITLLQLSTVLHVDNPDIHGG